MTTTKQRLRDPVHGLIVFDLGDASGTDALAWKLINTPEFQRLRRIRQLGVSDLVFPGATHTRFAHSIGVYHMSRRLLTVLKEQLGVGYDEKRAQVIQLAALLHDIGHGPFSHAFEGARKELAEKNKKPRPKKHEFFSADIIRNPAGSIVPILGPEKAEDIAQLVQADDPVDVYHAVVSSSFDADRLDYLLRDRYMTGTGVGAFDIEWLFDNLQTWEIDVGQEGDEGSAPVPTFAFKDKARAAVEDFILARYRLYTTVYLHKTTRGFQRYIGGLLVWLGTDAHVKDLGIGDDHPLIRFLRSDTGDIADYLQLDDYTIWSLIETIGRRYGDAYPGQLCRRLLARERPKCVDIARHCGDNLNHLRNLDLRLKRHFAEELGRTVFRDSPEISSYSVIDGEVQKEHKRIRVTTKNGVADIVDFSDTVIGKPQTTPRYLTRYYFLNDPDAETARKMLDGG